MAPGLSEAWVWLCGALGSLPWGGVALLGGSPCVAGGAESSAVGDAHVVAVADVVGFGGACGASVGCAAWASRAAADGVSGEDAEALCWGEASALAGLCRPGHRVLRLRAWWCGAEAEARAWATYAAWSCMSASAQDDSLSPLVRSISMASSMWS